MESRRDTGEHLGSQHCGRSRQAAFAESSLWRTAGIGQKRTVSLLPRTDHQTKRDINLTYLSCTALLSVGGGIPANRRWLPDYMP